MTNDTRWRRERAEQVLAEFTVSVHEVDDVQTVSFNYDEMRDLIIAALADTERVVWDAVLEELQERFADDDELVLWVEAQAEEVK